MRLLGLDVGKRRTGVAFADSTADILVAGETIHHPSDDELLVALRKIVAAMRIEKIVIGLPLLPQGEEGEQTRYVRIVADRIGKELRLPVAFIDERYSSVSSSVCADPDAMAACTILEIALSQQNKNH